MFQPALANRLNFLYSQLFVRPPYPTGSYADKTVIISGSNSGLGKEAARHFARLGASQLILAVRSLDRGHTAKADIEATTSCGKDVIQVWQLDMARYSSVLAFAARVDSELDRVDVVISNAGVIRFQYAVAEDNEEMLTVNVVSAFLFVTSLLPKLKATATRFHVRPTLSITSSGVHAQVNFPQRTVPDGQLFTAMNDRAMVERSFLDQYSLSKLLELFLVRAIGEKFPGDQLMVTVNCFNPGLCHSNILRSNETWIHWLGKLLLARTTEVGSRTFVDAASQGGASHGEYLSDCRVAAPAVFVTSPEGRDLQERIWTELCQKLNDIRPGIVKNFE